MKVVGLGSVTLRKLKGQSLPGRNSDCFINRISRTSLVSLEITYLYFMLTAH